jgi:signal transduction histidine kinase
LPLPFNIYAIHELVALMLAASMAMAVGGVYLISRRRHPSDLIFALHLVAASAAMAVVFLQDNLVQAGQSAWGRPGGPGGAVLAEWTLGLNRLLWQLALLGTALRLHFAFLYTGSRNVLSRRPWLLYGLFLTMAASLYLEPAMAIRSVPLAGEGGWQCPNPWIPRRGWLIYIWLGFWILSHLYVVTVLGRYVFGAQRQTGPRLPRSRMILAAFSADFAVVTLAMVAALAGRRLPALAPIGVGVSGLLVGIALLRNYQSLDRLENDLLAANKDLPHIRQRERLGLGRDVYERLSRQLSVLHLSLSSGLSEGAKSAHQRGLRLAEAIQQSRELAGRIRRICYGLFPPKLEADGLAPAVDQLVQQWRKERVDVTLSFGPDMAECRFSAPMELFLYRFCQEMMQMALHSGRSEPLEISMACREEQIHLDMFGLGDQTDLRPLSRRLADLSDQVDQMGGKIELGPREGAATLHLEVPVSGGLGAGEWDQAIG